MPPDVPLPTLLSQALVAFTIEFDNTAEARISEAGRRPWMVSQAMWANHLRFIGDDGLHARELRSRALVLARSLRSRLAAFTRWRYVTVDAGDVVRLTPAGRRAAAVWLPLAAEVEGRWCDRLGAEEVPELRAALAPVAAATDISVLLARALLVITLAFERKSPLSLPMCADGLRVLGSEPVRVRDLPRLTGGSKEALAMIVGHLTRTELATVGPDSGAARGKVVRLTGRGSAAKRTWALRLAAVEEGVRTRLGAAAVDRLRRALEAVIAAPAFAQGLVPPAGVWRGRPPYRAHTEGLIADPRGALPDHPLVLHRGGFPDGA